MEKFLNRTAHIHQGFKNNSDKKFQHFNALASEVAIFKGIPEALIMRETVIVNVQNFYSSDIVDFNDLPSTCETAKAFNAVRFSLPFNVLMNYRFIMSNKYINLLKPEDYELYSLNAIAHLLYQGSFFEWLPDEIEYIQKEIQNTGTYNSNKRDVVTYESIPMKASLKEHLIACSYFATFHGYNILDSDEFGVIPAERLEKITSIILHLPFFANLIVKYGNISFNPDESRWLGFVLGTAELIRLVNNIYVNSGHDYWKAYYFISKNNLWSVAAVSGFSDIDEEAIDNWVDLPKAFLDKESLTNINEYNLNYAAWS